MIREAIQFFETEIKPNAFAIDHDTKAMAAAFEGLKKNGFMGLKRPEAYGGPAMAEPDFRRFQEEIARYSGALAFLQTQHQSAVSLLNKQGSEKIKAEYLPKMHDEKMVGLGFSQLRRAGDPICRAKVVDGGFVIDGSVPWITGKGYFHEYIIGATMSNGQALFGMVPLKNLKGQTLSKPMKLAAMEAANTVSAQLEGYFLPNRKVAFIKDKDWMRANDAFNITLQGHFAIGCALAGIDVVRENGAKRGLTFLTRAASDLEKELHDCRQALVESQKDFGEDTAPDRLKKRAWAIDLMMRCAQAAVTSSSGAANSASHPANRVLREAIVFSVSAQTSAIMEATMDRLVNLR
ncbi:MAG: acyl-CoA dehydrogenase family protein [Armatimonadetes bacterium]|nr:acyl-CoA dehydrogenase family protein [Armatimonadota bacterium]